MLKLRKRIEEIDLRSFNTKEIAMADLQRFLGMVAMLASYSLCRAFQLRRAKRKARIRILEAMPKVSRAAFGAGVGRGGVEVVGGVLFFYWNSRRWIFTNTSEYRSPVPRIDLFLTTLLTHPFHSLPHRLNCTCTWTARCATKRCFPLSAKKT